MSQYVVQRGDCLSGIAWMHGFERWQTIYDAPENRKFRKRRPNPNVIYPGDELFIPDKKIKEVSCAVEKKHRFELCRSKWVLRIELRDEIYKGIESVSYTLVIPGGVKIEGKTGQNGLIETPVPSWARKGTLYLPGGAIQLGLGELDPVRQIRGVQQRLNNLGFNSGPIDGIIGPKTRRGIAAFQASQPDLKPTGILDDETAKRLLEIHDNDKRLSDTEPNAPVDDDETITEAGGTPGEGGWEGAELTCHPPDTGENATTPHDFYFAIYYHDTDGTRAFERAAETWRSHIAARAGFSNERYLAIEVKTEQEFVDAWLRIDSEVRQQRAWVREGHVFTHGSVRGDETGLEFAPWQGGGTLSRAEIEGLARVPWHPDGELVLHSCNGGVEREGWNPTTTFAQSQRVHTRGQTGSAFFSERDDRWVQIGNGSREVFLRAYFHGRNTAFNPIDSIGSADEPMPEFEARP
jgi:hypothetical protein